MEGLKILCQALSSNGIKRVRYNHTRMVQENIPYAYSTYRTRMVCTVRVRYEIRVRYPTAL